MKKHILTALIVLLAGSIKAQEIPSPLLLKNTKGQIPCLLLVSDTFNERTLADFEVKVQTKAGNVWSVLVPETNLARVTDLAGILAAEPASRLSATRWQMDSARNVMQADKLHRGTDFGLPQAFTGEDVIVGIVDIGFQHRHPAFYAKDSSTLRISRVWQQNYDGGNPPQGYSYGTEYIGKDEIFHDGDMHGTHGTHVAGIAAGSGIGSPNLKFKGIAPEAELVFVSIKYYSDELPGSALSDYIIANPAIIDAYNYIFNYAKSQGKPAVINLSWGMHTGPHDGTSLFDLATNELAGEGLILVGAAGNYGNNPMHFEHKLTGDTVKTIVIENERLSYPREDIYTDIWGSGNSVFSVSVHLIDTFGQIVYESPYVSTANSGSKTYSHMTDSGLFSVSMLVTSFYVPNSKPNNTLWISNPNPQAYCVGLSVTSPFCNLHAWNSGGAFRYTSGRFVNKYGKIDFSASYKSGNTDYTVGENGGTSKNVITVGASTAKNFYMGIFNDTFDNTEYTAIGAITPFSSKGPTADGRIKPDISAPGQDVAAPVYLQQYPGWAWNRLVAREAFLSDTFAYGVFSGTSMASPQVAGTVALMLQANPKLTPFQVKQILAKTAIVDNNMGAVPNNTAGSGKVNAFEAVKESVRIISARNLQAVSGKILAYPNPASEDFFLKSAQDPIKSVEIYTLSGVSVFKSGMEENVFSIRIPLQGLAPGVYIVKANQQFMRLLVD